MKTMKKCMAALLVGLMAVVAVTGCASFDASAYLKALMDNTYKNDSTAFVEQKIGTKEEAEESYQQAMAGSMDELLGYGLDDATTAEAEKLIADIYAAVDYTVGEAEKDGDTYIVTVTYKPMLFFDNYMDAVTAMAQEYMLEHNEQPSEEEAVAMVLEVLKNEVANVEYGEEATIEIRIEVNNNVYSPNQTDWANLEMALLGLN